MAGNKHLLFIVTACLGAPGVGHRDVKVEEDLPISDVDLPTVETVAKPEVIRRADISHPDVRHTSNGVQQISMDPTSSTHEAHRNASFLDASHHRTRTEVECKGYQYFSSNNLESGELLSVETCEDNGEDVTYVSKKPYYAHGKKAYLWVNVGTHKFGLSLIDWKTRSHFRCFMTSTERCGHLDWEQLHQIARQKQVLPTMATECYGDWDDCSRHRNLPYIVEPLQRLKLCCHWSSA